MQDQQLRGTSSWANAWAGRDHLSNPIKVATPDTPIPVTGRGRAAGTK